MKKSTKSNTLIGFGGFILLAGLVLAATFGIMFESILENLLVIEDGTAVYSNWVEPPIPADFKIYLFNVTNPYDIRFNGATPILEEIGPYTYTEVFNKDKVEFVDDNASVVYSDRKTYFFDPEKSAGTEDDIVTTANVIMILLAAKFYDNSIVTNFLWPEIENKMDLFQNYTVGELLFGGYDLPEFNFDFSHLPMLDWTEDLEGTLYEILVKLGFDPPAIVEKNKFALLALTNNTLGSRYKVNTGKNNMDEYLFIKEYNGETELDYWKDPYCNMINGTDGAQFPPFPKKHSTPRIFVGQFCRSLYLVYDSDVKVKNKLKANKYITSKELLEDPKTNSANACYCTKVYEEDEEDCLGSSFLNLAPCAQGLPIILSTPHFFEGDEKELSKIIGLHPDKEIHQTYMSVDPITGVVVSAAKRLQFNLPLRKYGNFPTFQNVPEVILPIFWLSEEGEIPEDDAAELAKLFTTVFAVGYTIAAVLMTIGIIMLLYGLKTRNNNGIRL